MFSVMMPFGQDPRTRNDQRFGVIDNKFDSLEDLLKGLLKDVQGQREGYRQASAMNNGITRGQASNLAQSGGYVAAEIVSRQSYRLQEVATELAVLSAGFEVTNEGV